MDERYTVAGLLRTQADRTPDETMLVCGGERRTWADQHRRSSQVAQALRADGVSPGDRVAFLDRNGLDYFDVLFGGALAGAVNVAVNWRLAPVEMAAVIDDSRAETLFVHPDYEGALEGLELPHVRRVVVLGDGTGSAGGPAGRVGYREWLERHPATDPGFAGGPDHVAMQLYTSGTTGLPKGVML
ncbi:MAG TPA: AMP-binding protein, partial [Acidimicrobiales bacterium]|nr:AMP-binding protein [Acidimicrobiales bacterium]